MAPSSYKSVSQNLNVRAIHNTYMLVHVLRQVGDVEIGVVFIRELLELIVERLLLDRKYGPEFCASKGSSPLQSLFHIH